MLATGEATLNLSSASLPFSSLTVSPAYPPLPSPVFNVSSSHHHHLLPSISFYLLLLLTCSSGLLRCYIVDLGASSSYPGFLHDGIFLQTITKGV
eukprot:762455-Hanusia_phi.AAC.3